MSHSDRVKNRKDIGRVEFLIDKFAGQEAMLETNQGLEEQDQVRESDPNHSRTGDA